MDQQTKQQDEEAIRSHFKPDGAQPQDKRAKILERVRAILALADGEQASNPEAADNYRAQADTLMSQYALEQWEVERARDKHSAAFRPKPEIRYMDFGWWGASERAQDLYSMFLDVAFHCRCVVAVRGYGTEGRYREMPVIGLPSDLDYLDLLFTHLMLQMGKQLEPKPDPRLGFEQNAYTLRAAGMARPRIAKLLYDMDIIPNTGKGTDYWDEVTGDRIPYNYLAANKEKSLRARVRVAGEKWGRANGHDPTTTVNPKVWQRSFAAGFVREIDSRMRSIRRLREQKANDDGTPGTELALRDIRQQAADLYDELFPPPPPLTDEELEEMAKKMKGRKAVVRSVKYSHRAMEAGHEAGSKADISGRPGSGLGKTPELPR